MSKLNINIDHSLSQEIALERIKNLLKKLKEENGDNISDLTEKWDEKGSIFSFKAMGMTIEGVISVLNDKVNLDAKIPLVALPFKGTIERIIKDEANKLLS